MWVERSLGIQWPQSLAGPRPITLSAGSHLGECAIVPSHGDCLFQVPSALLPLLQLPTLGPLVLLPQGQSCPFALRISTPILCVLVIISEANLIYLFSKFLVGA